MLKAIRDFNYAKLSEFDTHVLDEIIKDVFTTDITPISTPAKLIHKD